MGRVAEYTAEQIIEAGNTLESIGKRVTPFAIREKLGGGDPNRIKEIWTNHQQKSQHYGNNATEEDDVALPTEIQEALERNLKAARKQLKEIAADSFRVATSIAEKRVTSTIEEYQTKISEYEESEKDAFQSLDNSDRQRAQLEVQIESFSNKNETLMTENSKLIGLLESLKTRLSQLEMRERELSELQREYGKLLGKIETIEASSK